MTGWCGRHAIVTGAGSGIGAGISRALLREGATVDAVDIDPPHLADVPDEARKRLRAFVTDVSDEGAVSRLVAETTSDQPIHLLFNVAGIGSTTTAPDTSVEVWDRVLNVNARGTFLMCKHVIPRMIAAGGGSIVNMALIGGLVGLPRRAAYCASKGAVIALTRALAVDHRAACVSTCTACTSCIRAR